MFEPKLDQSTLVLEPTILTSLDIAAPEDAVAPARRYDMKVVDEIADSAAREAPMFVRLATISAVVFPPFALVAVMILAWNSYFGWLDLTMMGVMYLLTGLGITVGYHRLYTHKSFATRGAVAAFFAVCGSMAAQGPVIWWSAIHRKHHQHSDQHGDPHSPHAGCAPGIIGTLKGFVYAHMGLRRLARRHASLCSRLARRQNHSSHQRTLSRDCACWADHSRDHRWLDHDDVDGRAAGIPLGRSGAHVPVAPCHVEREFGVPHLGHA